MTDKRDMRGYIDITDLDVRKVIAAAFDRSHAQGMGFLHDKPGPVTDEEIDSGKRTNQSTGAESWSFDYLRGRSMKLHFTAYDSKLWWQLGWYDHSEFSQEVVLAVAGMPDNVAAETMERARTEQVERYKESA